MTHEVADKRSLALHRAVAEKVARDPTVLARARERVRGWRERGEVAAYYADAWAEILARAPDQVGEALVADDERMRALRQVSPFAGALDPRERWRILQSVRP